MIQRIPSGLNDKTSSAFNSITRLVLGGSGGCCTLWAILISSIRGHALLNCFRTPLLYNITKLQRMDMKFKGATRITEFIGYGSLFLLRVLEDHTRLFV